MRLGRAIVEELAAAGAKVVFTYRQGRFAHIEGTTAVRVDLEDLGGLAAMFEPVRDGLDILVNNAGVAAALEQVTAVAARELGPRGITVNTVSPGATDTDLLRSVNSPEALEVAASMTALGRLGRPADVAAVVAFLCGPRGGWVTGQNVRATGGLAI